MEESIIIAENISKLFQISHEGSKSYNTLRDNFIYHIKNFFNSNSTSGLSEEFWALKDLSFNIKQGDRVGIIGRNGAGKSTLLKLLSRITEPTSGKITIKGRVASLLEVGTGFHPELSGRENIFLNGAILGMSRMEIKSKFDEIVDFAEVEKFLDTPVKRYSSGMYVRLAFAVAAHLEPEILIVDEVLAVGDVQFQNKCLGKMDDVSKKEGRTVIFVSHNMSAIRALCNRGILLNKGLIHSQGSIENIISDYLSFNINDENSKYLSSISQNKPHFKSVVLKNQNIAYGDDLELLVTLSSPTSADVGIEIEIHDEKGYKVSYSSTAPMQSELIKIEPNKEKSLKIDIENLKFASGDYFVYLWLIKPWAEDYDQTPIPLKFTINISDPFKTGFDFKQSYGRGNVHHKLIIT